MSFLGVFILAAVAAAATVGLRTGSLAPYWPSVSRAETPGKFWMIVGICIALVAINVVNLLAR